MGEVDLVAPEVQEVGVDAGEPRLAARLGGDAGDEVVHRYQLDLVASDHPGDAQVLGVAHPRDDVVGAPGAGSGCW